MYNSQEFSQQEKAMVSNPFSDDARIFDTDASSIRSTSSSSGNIPVRKTSLPNHTPSSPLQDAPEEEIAIVGASTSIPSLRSPATLAPRGWRKARLSTAFEVPSPEENDEPSSYFDSMDPSVRRESIASPNIESHEPFYFQKSGGGSTSRKDSYISPSHTPSHSQDGNFGPTRSILRHSQTEPLPASAIQNPFESAYVPIWRKNSLVSPFDDITSAEHAPFSQRPSRTPKKMRFAQDISETDPLDTCSNAHSRTSSRDGIPEFQRKFSLRNFSLSQDNSYFNRPLRPPRRSVSENDTDPTLRRPSLAYNMRRNTMAAMQKLSVSSEQLLARRPTLAQLFGVEVPDPERQLPIFSTELSPETITNFMAEVKTRHDSKARHPRSEKMFPWIWRGVVVILFYFLLIGKPIWNGMVYSVYKFIKYEQLFPFACMVFIGYATICAWIPLLFGKFEPNPTEESLSTRESDAAETALIIPAYKAAGALPETIEHALKIFKPRQIFIIANGNSPTPLDDTADVCKKYGVNHTWVPVGSKITAEFVGCAMAKEYKYIIMIDDDVHLPENFPVVSSRLNGKTACIGYTIKSTGPNGSRGTLWQQAQDLEYKSAGMMRTFSGIYGSATFPHGAITLWDRKVLMSLFWNHPGYQISEDWYFGHIARRSGYRIEFCSQVFVGTETPTNLFWPKKDSSRGGYGEMTIWKQRMMRWDFFHLYRLKDNTHYLLCSWRLGWLEIVTKWAVFNEIYETLTYLVRPFFLIFTLFIDPMLSFITIACVLAMYAAAASYFNAVHLRKKGDMFRWQMLPTYFWMKFLLGFVDTASVFYQFYAYSNYFAKTQRKIVDNFDALEAAKKCMDGLKEEMELIMDDLEVRENGLATHEKNEKSEVTSEKNGEFNEKNGEFFARSDETV